MKKKLITCVVLLFMVILLVTCGLLGFTDPGRTNPNDPASGDTPADTTPPAEVTAFATLAGNGQVQLSWTNPTDPDFAGVKLVFKTTGFPTGHTDGTAIYDSIGTSYLHTGLTNGTTYYYTAYTYDTGLNYSTGVQASATPSQGTAGNWSVDWATKAPMLTARHDLSVGVVNNKIYAIGGWNGSSYLTAVEEYNPTTNQWGTKASMPTGRYG
ncbi:MAG: kelch repeat-containing protein, partial [Spirochaetota bacterium]